MSRVVRRVRPRSRWRSRVPHLWLLAGLLGLAAPAAGQPAADTRAIVLPDDAARWPGAPARLPPVTLRIPRALEPWIDDARWSVVVVDVRFPGMRPFGAAPRGCAGFCDGRLELRLTRLGMSPAEARIGSARRAVVDDTERAARVPGLVTAPTLLPPTPGYDETWDMGHEPARRGPNPVWFLRDATAYAPAEIAECPAEPSPPVCTILTDVNAGLHLELSFSAELWERRDEVRAAALRLARSFVAD